MRFFYTYHRRTGCNPARRGTGLYGVAEGNFRAVGARRERPLSLHPSAMLRYAGRPPIPCGRARPCTLYTMPSVIKKRDAPVCATAAAFPAHNRGLQAEIPLPTGEYGTILWRLTGCFQTAVFFLQCLNLILVFLFPFQVLLPLLCHAVGENPLSHKGSSLSDSTVPHLIMFIGTRRFRRRSIENFLSNDKFPRGKFETRNSAARLLISPCALAFSFKITLT